MKKTLKKLLFGAGIAAAGAFVYSLWKDADKSSAVRNTGTKPGTIPSKEYVARRRQQIRDTAEARKAAQEEAAQVETAQGEALNTVPVEAATSEQATEQQKAL